MDLSAYEGGSGGKFLRRPLRRTPATPYDRPPLATRGLSGLATSAGNSSGWISKFVDPASRFIAGSTSRLLSSVFRKRHSLPTEVQGLEQNCELNVPETVDIAPSECQIQEAVDGHNPTKDFGTPGISDIEQLLKQNIYTRAQVDYLTGLIYSRTFGSSLQESHSNNEKVNVPEEGNGERSTGLNRKFSTSETALTIPRDVAASPAEIAKAYMSSKLPKASSSALSLQSRVFQKDKSSPSSGPCVPKLQDLSVVPRSALHISDVHEFSSAVYPTPKPRGRSAIYRMSRSPYFKVSQYTPTSNTGHNTGPATFQWTPGSTSKSDSRQGLKRGSSFLDGEDGSFGPIRRIRQKSGLVSGSTNAQFMPSSSSHGTLLYLDKDDLKDPTLSEKSRSLNQLRYASAGLQNAENGDGKIFSTLPPVPSQSTEACRKILEQLDKFAPSRGEKSNMRSLAMDESPSKLTAEMLNGRARRSMDHVDNLQFTSMDEIGTSDYRNVSYQSDKPCKPPENGPSRMDVPRVKFETVANGVSKQAILNKASKPSVSSTDTTNPVLATSLLQRKPAFQMTAPEDLHELDDEQDAVDVSAQTTFMIKTDSKIAETESSVFGMSAPEIPLLPSSKNTCIPSSVSLTEISKEAYKVSQVSEKEGSFRFPVATESGGLSPQSLTPTMPFPSHDKLIFQREQTDPAVIFGFQNSGTSFPSSATAVANESPIESKLELTWPGRKLHLEASNLLDGKSEAYKHKSHGIVASSGQSAPGSADSIAFDTSITSTQSNGSIHSSSLPSLLSAPTPVAISNSPASLFSSNSKLTAASSSSPSVSTTSPVFSSTSMFSFGATASTTAPVLVSLSSDKSSSVNSEGKVAGKFSFGSSNPSTTQISSTFSSVGNSNISLTGSSTFLGSGSTPPAIISTPATPSIFSQVSSSGSGFAAPQPSSAQSSTTGFSDANGNFQNSSTSFGATGGSMFVQPAQSGSGSSVFSQSSTSLPGSFSPSAALVSNSTSWQSSSTFGLNSSLPGFGQVPFGTTNQTAKSLSSTSGSPFTSGPSNSSSSGFSFSSSTAVSSTSPLFSSIASASNSSSGLSFSTGSSTSNFGFSFSASASSCSPSGNTFLPSTTSGLLGSSSVCSTSSVSNSVFGSSPSPGFSFGLTAPATSVSSFGFGSSSGPVFSFTSSSASMSPASATPIFGMPSSSGGFSSVSPNNDQMNVEDTMADDTNQASGPIFPTFGQPNSTPASSNFLFGSAVPSGGTSVFQFGSQQNSSNLQNPNPFQTGGNLEFTPGGSFSLGSGGGDKSARKIVKVRRDKNRRK